MFAGACYLGLFAGLGLVALGRTRLFQGPLLAQKVLPSLGLFLVHGFHYLLEDVLLAIFRYFLGALFLLVCVIRVEVGLLSIFEEVHLVEFLDDLADRFIPFFLKRFSVSLFGRRVDLVGIFIIREVLLLDLVILWRLLFLLILVKRPCVDCLAGSNGATAVTLAGNAVIDSFLDLLDVDVEDVTLVSIGLEPLHDVLVELAVVAPRI